MRRGAPTEVWIDRALREIRLPEGSLVAVVHRGEETLVPSGRTVLAEGDRLTILGEAEAIAALSARWAPKPA